MTRQQLEISKIVVLDRQRALNDAHVSALAVSMKDIGLVQPIVINQKNRLVAGGHRLAAAIKLGWSSIDVCYRETMSEAELQELELTENLKRLDLTWQERVIAIAKIHDLKRRSAALDSKTWGQKETGSLLGVDQSFVSYSIIISRVLNDKSKDHEIWKADSAADAWNIIMRWQQEEAEALLAKKCTVEVVAPNPVEYVIPQKEGWELLRELDHKLRTIWDKNDFDEYIKFVNSDKSYLDRVAAHWLFANGDKTREDFDKAWVARKDRDMFWEHRCIYSEVLIDITSHYFKCDSIQHMLSNPECYDHIITDIPYGIDIENIDQHVGIKDIETIKAEHGVEENLNLYRQFFPAAFTTLKPNAFLITWLDQMNWQFMYDLAIGAGFKVQRWPITWVKTHQCLNQMAQFNFTKSTEIAMVCRKGVITLVEKQPTSVIEAGRDELCETINHPFAKPFACWERLITAVSIENQTILDPFVGRGSSFLAGLKLGRNMYGCEINEQHYNAGLENIKQYFLKLNPKSTFK